MQNKNFLTKSRWLVTIILLLSFSIGNAWSNETFTANVETGSTSVEKGCITISVTDGTFNRSDNYRCYASNSMTISSSHSITKVEITCTASETSNYGPGKFSKSSGTSGTYSYSGKVGTWSYASGATSITLNASTQVRMTQIVVTYTVTAPTALTKGAVTTNSIPLTITDGKSTGTYELYYNTASTAPNASTVATSTVTTKTPTITGLTAGTPYYVWVRSKCSDDSKSSWCALTGNPATTSSGASCGVPTGLTKGTFFLYLFSSPQQHFLPNQIIILSPPHPHHN